MYSALTKAPKHAVVVISELLAAHGHRLAMVKPTYQQDPSTNAVTLSCSTSMKSRRPKGRGIVPGVSQEAKLIEFYEHSFLQRVS